MAQEVGQFVGDDIIYNAGRQLLTGLLIYYRMAWAADLPSRRWRSPWSMPPGTGCAV